MIRPNKFAHMADGSVIVMLERRDGTVLACFVDASDWPLVRGYRWCAIKGGNTFYAMTHVRKAGTRTTLQMHQLLLPDPEVDHINGKGCDNRRENLRAATRSQNNANQRKNSNNTSGFKGVHWRQDRSKWRARIEVNGKHLHLGLYDAATDAARAYDQAALQHFGQFARVNFPASKAA